MDNTDMYSIYSIFKIKSSRSKSLLTTSTSEIQEEHRILIGNITNVSAFIEWTRSTSRYYEEMKY